MQSTASWTSVRRSQSWTLACRRGYTMAEIIIVIVVLGLLTAIAIPIYNIIPSIVRETVSSAPALELSGMHAKL